ncbi:hypothetical protein K2W90_02585 [Candidatus Babeliales bacterium]|nr:hypothetical protein [Candidatus Babeliales bacterium]
MKTIKLFSFSFLCLFSCLNPSFREKNTENKIAQAPRIASIKWGEINVKNANGRESTFKDCICTPGGAKDWDWGITSMRHNPGIGIAQVKDLLDLADVFVLSRGVDWVLQVQDEVVEYLEKNGKQVFVQRTIEKPGYDISKPGTAVHTYNELVKEGKRVVGLFHSTC